MNIIHDSNDEQAKAKVSRTDKVLPAGTYQAEIKKATARQSEYSKSTDNPDGWELSLWIDVEHEGDIYRVFDSIPCTHVNRLNEVLGACGLPRLTRKVARFEESNLEGCMPKIRTYVTKTTGKAKVGDYLEGQPQAAKPAATTVGEDKIPF